MADRLVIEWSADTVNWATTGKSAGLMPVVEIADPQSEPFPGFDSLLISHDELQAVVADNRYSQWRTALSSVQGIQHRPLLFRLPVRQQSRGQPRDRPQLLVSQ